MVMRTRPGVQLVANLQGLNVWAWTPGRWVRSATRGFFSFLYLKKIKISKIYGGFEKFQNYTLVVPCLGACRPLAGRQDLNVKKITFSSWRPGRIKQRTYKIDIKS